MSYGFIAIGPDVEQIETSTANFKKFRPFFGNGEQVDKLLDQTSYVSVIGDLNLGNGVFAQSLYNVKFIAHKAAG